MDLQIKIETIDRTNVIEFDSFKKDDNLTSQVDKLKLSTKKYGSRTWTPTRGDEIIVTDLDTTIRTFGGYVVDVRLSFDKVGTVKYVTSCTDYTGKLNDELIAKTYEGETIAFIIADIMPAGFTTVNATLSTVIDRITFNYITVTECIIKLAKLVGYNWYVDYYKDLHFIAKLEELAPFSIDDSSPQVIGGSLNIDKSNAQLRNVVYVRGGEYIGNSRSESYDADGGQKTFPLGNKFSEAPSVTKAGVHQIVGVDYLDDFTTKDVLWNFNEKYLKFDVAPTIGQTIEATGTPLVPLIVQVEDGASTAKFGRKSFKITDKNLVDPDTARLRASTELDNYADGVNSGSFQTYTDGLRSGQTIYINSVLLDVSEHYLIKKVSMRNQTKTKAIYTVEIVSTEVLNMIELLQKLLRVGDEIVSSSEDEVLTLVRNVSESVNIDEEITLDTENEVFETVDIEEQIRQDPWGEGVITWVFAPYFPTDDNDEKRSGKFDICDFS